MNSASSVPICIYHSPCLDGFTAAWAAWKAHPDWEFYKGVHGQPPPDVTGRDVYLLDFSYKRTVMKQMMLKANHITIIDHHQSAEVELNGLEFSDYVNSDYTVQYCPVKMVFDITHSGAYLAWCHFHSSVQVPFIVEVVEDRDLWRFTIPNSKEINAALFSWPYTFEAWDTLEAMLSYPEGVNSLLKQGQDIERKLAKDIKEMLPICTTPMFIGGVLVEGANLPYTMASDAAHILSKEKPFGATYFINKEGKAVFSLRSCEDGIDVSEIAKKYGGGGHKHAAGFLIEASHFKYTERGIEVGSTW